MDRWLFLYDAEEALGGIYVGAEIAGPVPGDYLRDDAPTIGYGKPIIIP